MRGRAWTSDEDAALRQWWPQLGVRASEHIPGRTGNACSVRASKLGLPSRRRPGWKPVCTAVPDPTPEEIRERAYAVRMGLL